MTLPKAVRLGMSGSVFGTGVGSFATEPSTGAAILIVAGFAALIYLFGEE